MTTKRPLLQPIARSTVVDAVTSELRTQILSGAMPPGSKLPAERELAEQLGVNRLTLRAALARLEALGLIATQHGTGSMVRDFRESSGLESLSRVLRIAQEREPAAFHRYLADLLDLRRTLAAEVVALAAERHTAEDLAALRAAIALQGARVGDVVAFARGDLDVARLVVRATGNLALELLFNSFARFPEDEPALARLLYPAPRVQHRHYASLLSLLEARDPTLARAAMTAALEAFDKLTLARVERLLSRPLPRTVTR